MGPGRAMEGLSSIGEVVEVTVGNSEEYEDVWVVDTMECGVEVKGAKITQEGRQVYLARARRG